VGGVWSGENGGTRSKQSVCTTERKGKTKIIIMRNYAEFKRINDNDK